MEDFKQEEADRRNAMISNLTNKIAVIKEEKEREWNIQRNYRES